MDEMPDDVRAAAIRVADEYRANTGDNAFNLSFDGTMKLLSMAILAERRRWQGEHPVPGAVTVTLEPRPDGGLRVWSASDPGLILSGRNADEVLADILPAAEALRELKSEPTL